MTDSSGPDMPSILESSVDVWHNADSDSHVEPDLETFHPSQLASECKRNPLVSKLGLDDNSDAAGYFLRGVLIHEFFEEWVGDGPVADELDVDLSNIEFEKELEADFDDILLTGRCDIIDTENDIVYDIKVRGGWHKFNPPVDRHLDQLHAYMGLAGANEGVVIYVNAKDPADIRTWPPQSDGRDTFEFDPERFMGLLEDAREIRQALSNTGMPTSKHEIPYDKCGCFSCQQEDLSFPADDADIVTKPLPARHDNAGTSGESSGDGGSSSNGSAPA